MPLPIVSGSPGSFGTETSPFGLENTSTSTTSTSTALGVGWWMVQTGAHHTVAYSPDNGTTKRTLIPASSGGLIWSDGVNLFVVADSTGDTSTRWASVTGPV